MNRRHFLGSLAALSAGMALDVDKLLWVPGRKSYFDIVPPVVSEYPIIWGRLSDEALENCVDYRYSFRWIPNPHREEIENGRVTIAVNVADWVVVS